MADTGGPAGGGPGAGAGAGNSDDSGEEAGGYEEAGAPSGYGGGSTGTGDLGLGGPMGSGGVSGSGVHDGSPGSASDADASAANAGLVAGINAAIAAGLDPFSSNTQNVIAAGILGGQFGNPSGFGIDNVDMTSPEVAGFMDQYGPAQSGGLASLAQNVYASVVPGVNTPLGILSAVPGLIGMSPAAQLGISAANYGLGIMGIGVDRGTTMSSIQDSINDMNTALN